jgi:hypothetical protein
MCEIIVAQAGPGVQRTALIAAETSGLVSFLKTVIIRGKSGINNLVKTVEAVRLPAKIPDLLAVQI